MCFFRKKKPKIEVNSKFKEGEPVVFRYRGDLTYGWIYAIHVEKDGSVIYDIQVGGQCPAILYNIKEIELKKREEKLK